MLENSEKDFDVLRETIEDLNSASDSSTDAIQETAEQAKGQIADAADGFGRWGVDVASDAAEQGSEIIEDVLEQGQAAA